STLVRRLIEVDRRFFELVKHEDNRAEQQNEKLHRDFHRGVEEQTEPTLFERASREVSLDLRLVSSEIRQREKKTSDQARPKGIPPVRVDRETDGLQFAHLARNRQRAFKRE